MNSIFFFLIFNKKMSNKNKLQEYYAKRKLELPRYITERIGGSSHNPIWKCLLKTVGEFIVESTAPSKKEAEQLAAAECLYLINESDKNNKITISIYRSFTIFVDIENKPLFIDELLNNINFVSYDGSNYHINIYIIASTHNPTFKKLEKECKDLYIDNIDIKFIPEGVNSMHKDAADTAMCVCAGRVLVNYIGDVIFVSSDHFIAGLVDVFHNNNTYPYVNAKLCNDYDSFIKILSDNNVMLENYNNMMLSKYGNNINILESFINRK